MHMSRYGHRRFERVYFSEIELIEVVEKFKAISPDKIYPVSYFLAHKAVHLGEALNLTWNKVDLEGKIAYFPAAGHANERTLPLSQKFALLLDLRDTSTAMLSGTHFRITSSVRAER